MSEQESPAAFGARARQWIISNLPPAGGPEGLEVHDAAELRLVAEARQLQKLIFDAGFAGIRYPPEYGGQGLTRAHQLAWREAAAGYQLPMAFNVTHGILGPTLLDFGTQEQKARHLPAMLSGEELWVQFLSEPAAGSDLAAVQARARQQDDGSWRLSGQKVWTTNAQFASYGLLLARTDADVPKHKGLTMFVVPMDAEGVTVRGLRQISGEAEFNEVFFDDVSLDEGAVVGGVGNGWGTALTTLMFERVTIGLGSEGMGYNSTRFAGAIAADEHARRDPEVRHQLGEIVSELLAVRFTGYRTLTALQKGQIPGPEAGLAKITIVKGAIQAGDLIGDVLGPDALGDDSEWAYMISFLPGLKSAGGTEEILRNTIGERVLGLPPAPRLDKGIPFSELRSKETAAA